MKQNWNNETVIGIIWLWDIEDAFQVVPKIREMIDWFKNRNLRTIRIPENMEVGFEVTVKDIFDFNMQFFNPSLVGIFRTTRPKERSSLGYGSWISYESLPKLSPQPTSEREK